MSVGKGSLARASKVNTAALAEGKGTETAVRQKAQRAVKKAEKTEEKDVKITSNIACELPEYLL